MAVFVFTGAPGAPGVTTTALGLALNWPRDVVLVDADRSPAQTVLVGYLAGAPVGGRGLTSLAQTFRDGLDLAVELSSHLVPLADEPGPRRWFLPGFGRPGSARLFEPVWPELIAALADLDRQGIDVLLDVGRWAAPGLPAGVAAHCRGLVVVTRSSLRALAALRLYASDIAAAVDPACPLRLVVVGAGNPYPAAEIGASFGWPVSELPWQPDDAAALSDGLRPRPKAASRSLGRAFVVLAAELRGLAERHDAQVARVAAAAPAPEAAWYDGVDALAVAHV